MIEKVIFALLSLHNFLYKQTKKKKKTKKDHEFDIITYLIIF